MRVVAGSMRGVGNADRIEQFRRTLSRLARVAMPCTVSASAI
jgi:hypothetical protein